MADRYAAAVEMAEWADRLGGASISVSEHHGSADGYLPSPVPILAAMAVRTVNVRLGVAALIAPFYHPLRLAEDLLVLDNLSRGRMDLIIAGGYVPEEFAMYGELMADRGKRVMEAVSTLQAAFAGEPFDYCGRTVHLTPGPYSPTGPTISLGGSSAVAARRAARLGTGFVPSEPYVWEYYREEVQRLGRPDPGPSLQGPTRVVALAEDPDRGWEAMAPYFLHETNAYDEWRQDGVASPYRHFDSADELRMSGAYEVLTPEQFVKEVSSLPVPFAYLHPLCGGMPIELAWSSLRLFEQQVLPAFV